MLVFNGQIPISFESSSIGKKQISIKRVNPVLGFGFSNCRFSSFQKGTWHTAFTIKVTGISLVHCSHSQSGQSLATSMAVEKKVSKKDGKKEHHLWSKRESTGSGQKALNLVRIVSGLPNEKEAVYGALDKWTAWETEFPLIAAAKALQILRKRRQWIRVIQVFADMEELGVKPDEDTVRKVAHAFQKLGQEDKQKLVLKKYLSKWKYIHHNGERVRVRRELQG
ncbi:pentatricopeptide repeat-containing protein At4g18975, chloroplastic isoform X2 [Actinidia eriantha]|uniref:pentatricopeptide repeat-containing protein At4g18975, chloroplastic isoform X2 n=1 Tax=Actinidia eriantha TaxID=165200 RepID=UPI002584BD62|nr:pentatricopeptide repeat-containing protein At4g18975, chloroplastic isoform X2 [Actinidia eriantha]